ncbi:MAG: DUF445 domain-containing protein [Sporomusaceae bacterium]|nr:DUF445 domain-containing protein [Sporomusaceae bacterium]
MKSKGRKATGLLLFFAGLFLVSLPYRESLAGGLLLGAASAALVGGIADWFAVTALFRRPLGIAFRTEIIPRNRERIFQELIDMLENTLLTKEHLKAKLAGQNLVRTIALYLTSPPGKDFLESLCHQLVEQGKNRFETTEIVYFAEKFLAGQLRALPAGPLAGAFLRWLIQQNYDKRILQLFLAQLITLCRAKPLHQMLEEMVVKTKETYSRGHSGRKAILDLLESGNLSNQEIAAKMQQELIGFLDTLQQPDSSFGAMSRLWLESWADKLCHDELTQSKAEEAKAYLIRQLPLRQWLELLVQEGEAALRGKGGIGSVVAGKILYQGELWLNSLLADEQKQLEVNEQLRRFANELIERYHFQLGKMARNSLEQYTNERLVTFLEEKVGDDLQMIRINGSLVGALLGIILYLIDKFFIAVGGL